jgi:hypothetical protein
MSDDKIMYDLLKEVRNDQKRQHLESVAQGKCLVEIKGDLKYHIKRTDILEDLHNDNQAGITKNSERIQKLELPGKSRAYLAKWWKAITSVIIVAIAIGTKIADIW